MAGPPDRERRQRRLLANFGYLTLVQGLNVAFPLLTYPYVIRALGPGTYGKVAFAQAIIFYCSVVVNFGFSASAPRDIAEHQGDGARLSQIVSSILLAKALLWLVALAALMAVVFFVPDLWRDRWLYFSTFGLTSTVLLLPDWYFLGRERVHVLTVVTFGHRLLAAVGIFALIRNPDDALLLVQINSGAAIIGASAGLIVMLRQGIRLQWQPWRQIRSTLSRSAPLFHSAVFASVGSKAGALVVGGALGPAALAFYDLAEKLTNMAAMLFINIGRAVYPALARQRDKAFSRKVSWVAPLVAVVGAGALIGLAPVIVPIFAGEGMLEAIPLVQLMAPYLLFATLGPLFMNVLLIENHHHSAFANTLVAALFHVSALGLLAVTGAMTAATVAGTFVAAHAVRSGHRYLQIRKYGLTDWIHR